MARDHLAGSINLADYGIGPDQLGKSNRPDNLGRDDVNGRVNANLNELGLAGTVEQLARNNGLDGDPADKPNRGEAVVTTLEDLGLPADETIDNGQLERPQELERARVLMDDELGDITAGYEEKKLKLDQDFEAAKKSYEQAMVEAIKQGSGQEDQIQKINLAAQKNEAYYYRQLRQLRESVQPRILAAKAKFIAVKDSLRENE